MARRLGWRVPTGSRRIAQNPAQSRDCCLRATDEPSPEMHNSSYSDYSHRPRPLNVRLKLVVLALALLLWVFSELRAADAPVPDFYAVIVDRSASMGPGVGNNNLIGPARQKLNEFVSGLEPNTTLEIVFFDSKVGTSGRWSDLTPPTKETILRWIAKEFRPSGGTRLYDTVGRTLTGILTERNQFGRIGLLVFSDGEDNESTEFLSWSEIEQMGDNLVAQNPAAFMRFYSLGREPRAKPGSPWVVQEAPDAEDLRQIVLEPPPEAQFQIIPDVVKVGEKVTFVALQGAGRIASTTWDFGDGESSSGVVVEHVYSRDGSFGGTLAVAGPGGSDSKPFSVTVQKLPPLIAEFSWMPRTVRVGSEIQLHDESTGGPSLRRWFVNGVEAGEGTRFPWHADDAGSVHFRLEVVRGAEAQSVEHAISVLPPELDAAFTILPGHSVVLGTEIALQASGSCDGAVHEWLADGGALGSGPAAKWKPVAAGLVEITHRLVRGDEMATTSDRVHVIENPPPAGFDVSPGGEVDLGDQVSISARTTDPDWRHRFELSTGEVFEEASFTIPMRKIGRVDVMHAVEGPAGRSEARETLIVRDAVTPTFTVNLDGTRAPAEVRFSPESDSGVVAREWLFGDGHSSAEASPVHTYAAPGEYWPVLKVRDAAGREHSYSLPNAVVVAPPRPWWVPWALGAGLVLFIGVALSAVVWDRQRFVDLDGRLEWQFGSIRKRVELSGRRLDLGSLGIPAWKPAGKYALVRRKAAGFLLLRDGAEQQAVGEDTCLDIEGVRLRVTP